MSVERMFQKFYTSTMLSFANSSSSSNGPNGPCQPPPTCPGPTSVGAGYICCNINPGEQPSQECPGCKKASSPEFVGEFWLGEVSELVI